MPRFREKPYEVEARQLPPQAKEENFQDLMRGDVTAKPGDWIVTEPSGNLTLMSDHDFNARFELVQG